MAYFRSLTHPPLACQAQQTFQRATRERSHSFQAHRGEPKPRQLPPKVATLSPTKKFAIVGIGALGFGLGLYFTSIWRNLSPAKDNDIDTSIKGSSATIDRSAVYDEQAPSFDNSVDLAEFFMGVKKLRRKMAGMARGHVLEVAAGTGRNTAFYSLRASGDETASPNENTCLSLTLLDKSAPMLRVAERKWLAQINRGQAHQQVRFLAQDAFDPIPAPSQSDLSGANASIYSETSSKPQLQVGNTDTPPFLFDTVIHTNSLCSTPDPEALIHRSVALVREGGSILLLEHGRSNIGLLNRLLDRSADAHAARHGCWWNRDVGAIVQACCRASGGELQLVNLRRYHFGTIWWAELRRGPAN